LREFAVAGERADVGVDLVLVGDVDLDGDGDLAWTPKAGTAHTILLSIATTPSSRRISESQELDGTLIHVKTLN
jgi:hypothetical protein